MRLLTVPCALLFACKAPEEAPAGLRDLAAYLYAHHPDEDPEALAAGLANLRAWLEAHPDKALEGYEVGALDEATVDALDEQDRTTEGMVGLSVTRVSAFPVEDSTYALAAVDQDEIYPDTFVAYEREYLSDLDCFLARTCLRLEAMEELTSSFIFDIQSQSTAHNQYVWVEVPEGWAMVHRNWQVEPPVVDISWLDVDEQAYLNVFVPGAGGVWRMQAQWTVYDEDNDVPMDVAMQAVIDFLIKCHDDLEAWLGDHPVP
jgi:hypothetical protein